MDDRLFHEFLANTLVGSLAVALAAILVLRQENRGDLAMAGSWFCAGVLAITTPLLAGQVDANHIRLVDRIYVLPLMGLYITTPLYIRYLALTSRSTTRSRTIVNACSLAASLIGLSAYLLAFLLPARFLNRFVYCLGDSQVLHRTEFWLFGTPLVVSSIVLVVAWGALARQDLDTGERARTTIYSIVVIPLLFSLILPLRASVISFTLAYALNLFGIVSYWTAKGERAAFLSRFLSPQVTELVRYRGLNAVVHPQELTLSVVCVDFRGFTAYTEAVPSQAVIELLRDYHEAVAEAVAAHDGMIKDYAGDGILILVGAPIARSDHQTAAVALALDARAAAARVTDRWATGPHPLGCGIGISSGRVTVGAIGEIAQMEYAAVGTPVNLAARLCALAENGAILLDDRIATCLGQDRVLARGETPLKGLSSPVAVYQLRSDSESRAVAGESIA